MPRLSEREAYALGYDIKPFTAPIEGVTIVTQPAWTKRKRQPRGARGRGIAYEGRVASAMRAAVGAGFVAGNSWLRYGLADGTEGYCEVDLHIVGRDRVLVMEAKLTAVQRAHRQLTLRYGPLLSVYYDRPAVLIQVCRHATPETRDIVKTKDLAMLEPSDRRVYTLPLFL